MASKIGYSDYVYSDYVYSDYVLSDYVYYVCDNAADLGIVVTILCRDLRKT